MIGGAFSSRLLLFLLLVLAPPSSFDTGKLTSLYCFLLLSIFIAGKVLFGCRFSSALLMLSDLFSSLLVGKIGCG